MKRFIEAITDAHLTGLRRIITINSTRVMLLGMMLAGSGLFLAGCSSQPESDSADTPAVQQQMETATQYTCPMHENVVLSEPGDCPICGMALVKVDHATQYTCPMHENVVMSEPGECPECGMDLVAVEEATMTSEHQHDHQMEEAAESYTCPMHPDVVQDGPGTCPECNMNLVPKDA